jgi:putative membrane protein
MNRSLIVTELKEVFRDRKNLLIPIFAVLFIPILYAGIYLWAFWDPYGHLERLPVVVVNNDKGADFSGEKLNLGDEVVKQLKKSDEFDFHFDNNRKRAYKDLKNHKYYLLVEIPNNFSKNATTLLDDHPQKMSLKYVPNEGYNFLSAQMGRTAMKEIRASIQKNVTKTYADTMFDKIREAGKGMDEASKGAGKLNQGAVKLADGAKKLKENLKTLASKSLEFNKGILSADKGSQNLENGAENLHSGLNQLSAAHDRLYQGSKDVQHGTEQLAGGIGQLSQGLNTVDRNMNQLVSGTKQAQANVQQFAESMPKLQNSVKDLAAGAEQLNGGIDQFQQQLISQLNNSLDHAAQKQEQASQQMVEQLKKTLLAQGLPADRVNLIIQQFQQQLPDPKQSANQQKQEIQQQVSIGFSQLKAGSKKLAAGSQSINSAINGQVAPNIQKLNGGLQEITAGQEKLQFGIHQLANGSHHLNSGSQQLLSGESQFVSKMGLLNEKMNEAADGSEKLSNGAQSLNTGLSQLSSGSKKISDGTKQLAAGADEFVKGSGQLKDGTKDMHDKLRNGAKHADSMKTGNDQSAMMAEPVKVKEKPLNKVPTYGTGLAPYFISLGLYVGALMLTIVYPVRKSLGKPKNGVSWFFSKFAMMGLMGVLQALITAAILLLGLKMEVQSIPLFIVTTILTSLAFIAIIQMLVTIGDNSGRFVAVLILIGQLTTSAGTFPLELVPKWFQIVHAFLPMTYSVNAFKAVISSGDFDYMWHNHLILLMFMAVFMAITLLFMTIVFKRPYSHIQTAEESSLDQG